jgi:hypothetical protein
LTGKNSTIQFRVLFSMVFTFLLKTVNKERIVNVEKHNIATEVMEQGRLELTRFFRVAQSYSKKTNELVLMPSCIVDSVWHDLLEKPKEYKEFTHNAIGCDVGHEKNNGKGIIQWTGHYEEKYGKLSEIWFTSPCGKLDNEAYNDYISTGKMLMAWDCNPAIETHNPDKEEDINKTIDINTQ